MVTMRFVISVLGILVVSQLMPSVVFAAQDVPAYQAPSVDIPPKPVSEPVQELPPPGQQIRRTVATLDEEIESTLPTFVDAYQKAKSPRVLVLVNRTMEDNDDDTMVEIAKVQGGISKVQKKNGETTRLRKEGGGSIFIRKAPDSRAYTKEEMERIRLMFEGPFVRAKSKLVDRDIAVRIHGLTEEEVFAYQDLPETKQSQVAAVKKYADILVTVRVERGEAVIKRVSGDQIIEVPNMVVRAIRLSDAQVLATSMTNQVRPGTEQEMVTRVALILMRALASSWQS